MLILAVACAIALGWCAGGQLRRFEGAGLKWLPLPICALFMQGLMSFFPGLTAGMVVISYSLLLLFLFLNRHLGKLFLFAGLGTVCNAVVIAANGFCMPVSERVLAHLSQEGATALLAGEIPMYCAAGAETNLLFLGDVFYVSWPVVGGFASIGDILLAVGIFFCILKAMEPTKLPKWMISG